MRAASAWMWLALGAAVAVAAAAQDGAADEECTCVPYYQCDNNGTVIKNGVGLIDIRIKEGACEHYLDVCCREPRDGPPAPPPSPPGPAPPPAPCGQRQPDGVGFRITGAEAGEAQFGEFPWMVALLREDPLPGDPDTLRTSYICGGSLLHPSVVLTAAHCVASVRSDRLWARVGEWDTQTRNEPLAAQELRVVKVALHPDFRADALYNDVALLTLEKPVELEPHVAPVCLPRRGADQTEHARARCLASGWGKDVFGKEGSYQVILKKVEVPVVAREQCIERLRETRLGKFFSLHDSFMCAGGAGADTCQGDGGGPLVCPLPGDPSRYEQVGIVAWGIGCGGTHPAVYADVGKFRDWIDQQFLYANLDTPYAA